jgi:hypothetical protein
MNQTTDQPQTPNFEPPKPVRHGDNIKSRMPDRGDQARNQSPADRPGKAPGEGEPPTG